MSKTVEMLKKYIPYNEQEKEEINILEDENCDIGWLTFEELISKSKEPYLIPVYEKIVEKIKKL